MTDNAKDTEQLLFLLSLAQVQDAATVRRLFGESLGEMYPRHKVSVMDRQATDPGDEALVVPIATLRMRFGSLRVTPALPDKSDVATVRNLTALLAVLLENLNQRDELRRRAEQTEALLSNIVRRLPVLVYVLDLERREIVYQNSADHGNGEESWLSWATQGPPHLTGRACPEASEDVARHLDRLSTSAPGEVVSLEFRTACGADGERWLLSHDTRYAPDASCPPYVLGACVDITATRKQADELREAVAQRDVLLNEVHHRVKNNMQIIVSLLNLQEDVPPARDFEDVFVQIRNRVAAMALVHEQLYHSHTLSAIDVRAYLGDLISTIRQSYERLDSPWRIAISCDDFTLGLEPSIPFGLLVTELVSNALKHAGGPAPELRVAVRKTIPSAIELEVSDNGPGIPDEAKVERSGVGLTLVDSLVRQLDGTMERDSSAGTRWTIRFPDSD